MVIYGGNRLTGFDPYSAYARETSMTAGLLCLFGLINLVPGVYDLVLNTTDGQDWSGDTDIYPPVVTLLAALIQVIFSVVAMVVGFQWLVSGAGSKKWSLFSFMLSLLSFFTFAVAVSYISFLAAKLRVDFIPSGYSPSNGEHRSVATLLVLGYIAYAANNFIALVHLNCKLLRFQSGKGSVFTRAPYRKLYAFQGLLTLLAGVVQLALGAYIYHRVTAEEDRLVWSGYLGGPYAVTYPEVSMIHTLLGENCFIHCLSLTTTSQKPRDHNARSLKAFQSFAWFVLAQLSMLSNEQHRTAGTSGFAAQAVALVVGLGLFPIYLDAMYHTTPETIEQGTFSPTAPWTKRGDFESEERKIETGTKPEVEEAKAVEGGDVKPAESAV
ncbi:unnamed protein product [Ascophyllum nodosum]